MDERALELARDLPATAGNIERLARECGAEAARWAFGQWELRRRARAKFARAEEMLFDRDGLEMASHEEVAQYHASLFPAGVKVADLTVGIGADLIALAGRGPAVGFELEPGRAALAQHNLEVHGLARDVRVEDAMAADWSFEYAFADPSRRTGGKRTFDPDSFLPSLGALVERMASLKLGVVKLSPMLPDAVLSGLRGSVTFLSHGGECKEALVVLGSGAPKHLSRAAKVTGDVLESGGDLERVEEPGAWIYEADPAAIRAHALPALAGPLGLAGLGDSNGFLTGADGKDNPWLKGYRVLWSGPGDRKKTQEALRSLGAKIEAVKTRGADEPAEAILKRFASQGERRVVLLVWRSGKSLRHALAEPQLRAGEA